MVYVPGRKFQRKSNFNIYNSFKFYTTNIYKDKKLSKYKFASCDFDVEYYFSIKTFLNNNLTIFNFNNENIETVNINVNNKIILTLGFYFGGSTRAPHKMHINYKK